MNNDAFYGFVADVELFANSHELTDHQLMILRLELRAALVSLDQEKDRRFSDHAYPYQAMLESTSTRPKGE